MNRELPTPAEERSDQDSPTAIAIDNARLYARLQQENAERKRAEQALQDSEEFLQTVFNVADDAIFVVDPVHDRIIESNHKACQMLGYGPGELAGLTVSQFHPQQMQIMAEVWETLQKRKVMRTERLTCTTKSQCVIPAEISFSLLSIKGQQYALAIMRDISERKRAEEELSHYREHLEQLVEQRTAELTRSNEALTQTNRQLQAAHDQLLQAEKMASIGQLAAGVAHEINNPIAFVHSNLSSLEQHFKGLVEVIEVYARHESVFAQYVEVLKLIQSVKERVELDYLKTDVFALLDESKDGLQRVKKIVEDLKDFSHVGDTEWHFADLHRGLDSTLNIVSNELKYKASVVKQYGLLPEVECLPLELNQVFMNLLINAGQAIAEQGRITISTGVRGDEVWVEIADTGAGIAPEILNRIFDPFFTTKPVGKGTGLGLSVSYGIVQKHHGRFEVTSELGKGTTFRVLLPLRQPV